MNVAIVFWSGTGNTEAMASCVAEGAAAAGGTTETIQAADFTVDRLSAFDAIAFGCPAMGAEELESDEFQPMWDEVKTELGNKKVALFGSYEWAEGEWMETWKAEAEELGLNVVGTQIAYDTPDADAEQACRELGTSLAQ